MKMAPARLAISSGLAESRMEPGLGLVAAGYALVHCDSWHALWQAVPETSAAVLIAPAFAPMSLDAALDRFTVAHPAYPVVLVLDHGVEVPDWSSGAAVADVLVLGRDEDRLPEAVQGAIADSFFRRAARRVRAAQALPPAIRIAVARALLREPPGSRADAAAGPHHSTHRLAEELLMSDDYLRRSAYGVGLDLAMLLRWCAALRALELHATPGTSWEMVACRLGFQSSSGVTELFRNTLGVHPGGVLPEDATMWFDRFEHEFIQPLLASGPRVGA